MSNPVSRLFSLKIWSHFSFRSRNLSFSSVSLLSSLSRLLDRMFFSSNFLSSDLHYLLFSSSCLSSVEIVYW